MRVSNKWTSILNTQFGISHPIGIKLVVMSPSRAEGFSARLGSARGLFSISSKKKFSSKIRKLAFLATQIFFSYFTCIFTLFQKIFVVNTDFCY